MRAGHFIFCLSTVSLREKQGTSCDSHPSNGREPRHAGAKKRGATQRFITSLFPATFAPMTARYEFHAGNRTHMHDARRKYPPVPSGFCSSPQQINADISWSAGALNGVFIQSNDSSLRFLTPEQHRRPDFGWPFKRNQKKQRKWIGLG